MHKADAAHQRSALKVKIEQLGVGEVVIIGDFKTNCNLPLYFRQISREHYNKSTRSFLGFTVFSYNVETKVVEKRHFDFLSQTLTKNTNYVKAAFYKMLENPIFAGMQNLSVWWDNGPGQV